MQDTFVTLSIFAQESLGPVEPIWRSIGYDEINWTYAQRGHRLLGALRKMGGHGFYIRNHNVFTDFYPGEGPGTSRGGTNCYREDASGNPVLDWTLVDRVYDTFVELGHRPIVEIGFMPAALSAHPPDRRQPPRDYDRWQWLCRSFAEHLIDRYGIEEVRAWYFGVWNEPDLRYWCPDIPLCNVEARAREYCRLYDHTVAGLHQASPELRVGGPEIAGPGYENPECRGFLEFFLHHCTHGPNFVDGTAQSRLDFISLHGKATGRIGHRVPPPNLNYMIADRAEHYRNVLARFPQFSGLPVLLDEWDIDFGTHSTLERSPEFAYRNTAYYAAYLCRMTKELLDLRHAGGFKVALATQWAFYHPDSECFAGRRHLVTYGDIAKPVLNALRMLETLSGDRVRVVCEDPVSDAPYVYSRRFTTIDALALREENAEAVTLRVLLWNQVRDPSASGTRKVHLVFCGLPVQPGTAALEHWRIDRDHSNAHTVWQEMGSPPEPTEEQLRAIRAREGLEPLHPEESVRMEGGHLSLDVELPVQGVSLLVLRMG